MDDADPLTVRFCAGPDRGATLTPPIGAAVPRELTRQALMCRTAAGRVVWWWPGGHYVVETTVGGLVGRWTPQQ